MIFIGYPVNCYGEGNIKQRRLSVKEKSLLYRKLRSKWIQSRSNKKALPILNLGRESPHKGGKGGREIVNPVILSNLFSR